MSKRATFNLDPLKLVPPGTNFSGPTLKNLFPLCQPCDSKFVHNNGHEVTTKDISDVHSGMLDPKKKSGPPETEEKESGVKSLNLWLAKVLKPCYC